MTRALISFLSHPYCFAHRRTVPGETSILSRIIRGERYRFFVTPMNVYKRLCTLSATGCKSPHPIEKDR